MGACSNALLELGHRARGKGLRDDPAPLGVVRRVEVDDRRVGREQVHLLDQRTTSGGERFIVAMHPRYLCMFGADPELPADPIIDGRGELLVIDRSRAAQFSEYVIGKALLPQREVGEIKHRFSHRLFPGVGSQFTPG